MQRILLTLCLIIAIASHAAAQQVQSTAVDLRKPNSDFSFSAAEQTTPTLRAYIRENGGAYTTITNLGAVFFFASNATDEVGMAVTNTTRGADYLEWTLTKNQTAVPGTYFAQIIVTNNAGSLQEWVRGEFVIEDSPGTTAIASWEWSSTNYATVTWVNAQIAAVEASITGMVGRTEFLNTNTTVNGRIDVLETGKVDVATFNASNSVLAADLAILDTNKVDIGDWQASNAVLQAGIEDAQGMATMGGDVSGPSTNALVIKLHGVSVPDLGVGAGKDGYTLAYDHDTASLILSPAAVGGTTISNLVLISGTSTPTSVAYTNVGIYRTIRSGNLPALVLNAGGSDVAYFDLLGITLRSGSIHLLTDFLSINPAAYDGSVTAPAYTWDEDRDLGKYRLSYNGDYGEGFCVGSNLVWFWAADGIHLTNGARAFGINYGDLTNKPSNWAAGTGLTNSGTATAPTGSLNAASVASLAKADTAVQSEADTNALAQLSGHTSATGSAVHGLGDISTRSSNDFYLASNPNSYLPAANGIASNIRRIVYIGCISSNSGSHAEGTNTLACGSEASHAEGINTIASGALGSHAEGIGTVASGSHGAHAEGVGTTASGQFGSHAEGESTVASGEISHAEGMETTASGNASHAEGYQTTASGYMSHAEGQGTTAAGGYSHAAGQGMTVLATNAYGWSDGTAATNEIEGGYVVHAKVIELHAPAIRSFGTNYIFYADSTNYVAMWADLSAYYLQAVSNGTASAVKTNALW